MNRVYRNSRHIRWNWEQSPDDNTLVRYHFIVVDDKNREGMMNNILPQITGQGPIQPIRTVEGKVVNSGFRYLFVSCDSRTDSNMINWSKINRPIKKDPDLIERQRGTIEEYVSRIYELAN